MPRRREYRGVPVVFRDILIGLVAFWVLLLASAVDRGPGVRSKPQLFSSAAQARQVLPPPHADPADVFFTSARYSVISTHGGDKLVAQVILGLVCPLLVAVNLWFYRHLRRASASLRPLRGGRSGMP